MARQREKVEKVARRYRREGYEVDVDAAHDDILSLLGNYQPDLVAKREGEVVIVEVKSAKEFGRSAGIGRISNLVQSIPGWRFDLVIPEREHADPTLEGSNTMTRKDMARLVNEFENLLRDDHIEAATLIGWSVLEGLLRLRLVNQDIEDDHLYVSMGLLNRCLAEGVVTQREYDQLSKFLDIRNRIAHGLIKPKPNLSTVKAAAKLIRGYYDETFRMAA